MKHIVVPTILSLLIVTSACGEPEKITVTTGEFAEDLMQAICERGVACGFLGNEDVGACIDIGVSEICMVADCSATITADNSDYQDCFTAYDDFSCVLLNEGRVPSECNTIIEF